MNSEIDDLQEWLNGNRDFDQGLMLYIAYINEADTRFMLERHRSSSVLFNALRERFYFLRENHVPEEQTTVATNHGATGNEHEAPAELLTRWGELKTEQERWHTEMSLIGEGQIDVTESQQKQRATLAALIMKHEDSLQDLGSAINFYRLHGRLPDGFKLNTAAPRQKKQKPVSKLNDLEKIVRLKNSIMPGISKLIKKISEKRKELASLKGKDFDKANRKLGEWEQQLQELQEEKKKIVNA